MVTQRKCKECGEPMPEEIVTDWCYSCWHTRVKIVLEAALSAIEEGERKDRKDRIH